MKIKLFELSEQTRLVELDREWISTIKEFKELIRRDKGSRGDTEARRKLQATKELTFVYHFCDFNSKFANYGEDEKLKECLHNAELPANLNPFEDDALAAAIKRYKSLQETPALKVLNELREGIHSANRVVRKLREALEKDLTKIDLSSDLPQEEDSKGKPVDPLTKITTKLEALFSISNKIPEALQKISDLEEKVKKELADDNLLRGDVEKGVREDRKAAPKVLEVAQTPFDDL